MALLKFGGGIIEMRGSIAGNTYSRNRYGAYARARTKPVNPNTGLQQAVRAAMAFLTDRWSNTLTAAQRTAWNLYGSNVVMTNKLGESINLSGFNHYIRSNLEYKTRFGATIDAGPVVFEIPAADPTFAVTASEGTQFLTVVHDALMAWADENGAAMLMYQGIPQNAQRNFFGGPWRYFANIPGINGAPAGSPSDHAAVFAIAELQRQWIYARIIRADGRLSAPFRADCFVGA
ncbi:hypothetical protein KAR91_84865 [Candidatus Pacearchaeota archaeon]|nr:hypothetical protein [Candidatus Pacearchaeota archaeon]